MDLEFAEPVEQWFKERTRKRVYEVVEEMRTNCRHISRQQMKRSSVVDFAAKAISWLIAKIFVAFVDISQELPQEETVSEPGDTFRRAKDTLHA
jgi:hypothetical protein